MLTGYVLEKNSLLCYAGRVMKKNLFFLSLGACMALTVTSCQNNSTPAVDGDYEEAIAIADGAIPPWLEQDKTGAAQIPAGTTTDRNSYSIPEPGSDPLAGLDEPTTPPDTIASVRTSGKKISVASTGKTGKKASSTRKRGGKPGLYIYTVRKGDTLDLISKQSGTSVAAIKRATGLKSDLIRPGQKIKVPYKLKEPKISGNGKKASSSAKQSAKPTVRYNKTRSYTAKKGDTLKSIAKKFGSSEKAIRNATGLKGSKIKPGQTVKIPM